MIKHRLVAVLLCAAAFAGVDAAVAQTKAKPEKDIAGSKDHPLLQRFEGSYIAHYAKKAFAEHKIALERVTFDYDAGKLNPFKTQNVEGAQTTFVYVLPKDVSTLEAVRAYEEELRSRGEVEVLFQGNGKEQELDDGYDRFVESIYKSASDPASAFMRMNKEARYLAAKLTRPEGDVYLTVYAAVNAAESNVDVVPKDRTGVRVDIIETKPRAQRMVTVTASEMSSSLSKAGRVALYGILFDFNKTDLKPESTPALQEIAKLLEQDAALKLVVTGHTDNVGSLESNRDLSQRRAAAVVAALTGQYRVAPARLQPFGASFAAPVAPNSTEEGRAKNRRVELVPF
ncbi:MAG: OmpA family protein [Chthoniobacterales bacterium]|nr:OmpA family protein [Chthoniobacterales bacterium]